MEDLGIAELGKSDSRYARLLVIVIITLLAEYLICRLQSERPYAPTSVAGNVVKVKLTEREFHRSVLNPLYDV